MPIITTTKLLRPRDPHDFYPTPAALCAAALRAYAPTETPRRVLDPGAGGGPWGRAVRAHYAPAQVYLVGVDLFAEEPPGVYDAWIAADYCTWAGGRYDLICGNPPYGDAETFVRRAWHQLTPGGDLIFLLRLAFLEGQARGRGLWRELQPAHVAVCSARPSFTGNGKTDATAYAVYHWQRSRRSTEPALHWLDWIPKADTLAQQVPA